MAIMEFFISTPLAPNLILLYFSPSQLTAPSTLSKSSENIVDASLVLILYIESVSKIHLNPTPSPCLPCYQPSLMH